MTRTTVIAGATGYLGRHLVAACAARGDTPRALVRDRSRATDLHAELFEAEATRPDSLHGLMTGTDLVISALGITRQRDGLTYRDVDYQANLNLLQAALKAGVKHFCYIHVLGAESLRHTALVKAKQAFVDALRAAPIQSTVICPSGYFSDMGDFMDMARRGRVWLFGNGQLRLNPIHGADLAEATLGAITRNAPQLDVGGPDILTHDQIAQAAFAALNRTGRITHLPDWTRRAALAALPLAPSHLRGPAEFFLSAMGQDMVGQPSGQHRLQDHFAALAQPAVSSL